MKPYQVCINFLINVNKILVNQQIKLNKQQIMIKMLGHNIHWHNCIMTEIRGQRKVMKKVYNMHKNLQINLALLVNIQLVVYIFLGEVYKKICKKLQIVLNKLKNKIMLWLLICWVQCILWVQEQKKILKWVLKNINKLQIQEILMLIILQVKYIIKTGNQMQLDIIINYLVKKDQFKVCKIQQKFFRLILLIIYYQKKKYYFGRIKLNLIRKTMLILKQIQILYKKKRKKKMIIDQNQLKNLYQYQAIFLCISQKNYYKKFQFNFSSLKYAKTVKLKFDWFQIII